jgi:hypothetical protein
MHTCAYFSAFLAKKRAYICAYWMMDRGSVVEFGNTEKISKSMVNILEIIFSTVKLIKNLNT